MKTLSLNHPEHVEVFPVDIKLDYKPKRVDYKALREGRTIELMNFFHFDGADITLRHITLSGVSLLFTYIREARSFTLFYWGVDHWLATLIRHPK